MLLSIGFSVLLVVALAAAQITTSLPPQSAYTPPPAGVGNGALPPISYTYQFTVTTATTAWQAPTFQTASPSAEVACSDTMCPDVDHKICKDAMGTSYGILCDTRFIGIIITTSGKKVKRVVDHEEQERDLEGAALAANSLGEREAEMMLLEDREIDARTFTGTFEGCADACDMVDGCLGMSFNAGFAGNCQSLSSIDGSFEALGEVAAVKQ